MLSIITRRRPTVMVMAGELGTAVRRVTQCRVVTVRPTEARSAADGALLTAARRVTRCKVVIARLIKVRWAVRLADMATELSRAPANAIFSFDRVPRRNFAMKIARFECSSGGRWGDRINRGN